MTTAATNERQKKEQSSGSWRDRLIVILLILGAILGLTYYQLPKAIITITPQVFEISDNLVFAITQLSGIELQKTNVMLTRRTAATGRQQVGITRAKGVVTLVNQSNKKVVVPKGTLVSTGSGVSFATIKDVEVPALATHYFMDVPVGLVAGQAEVGIEASELGSNGNVAAGRILSILGFDLDVRNPDPTLGGEDAVLNIALAQDLERAKDLVKNDARPMAFEALQQVIGKGLILDDTMEFEIEWKEMTNIGDETEEVYVVALSKGQVYTTDLEALGHQLNIALQDLVPMGFKLEPSSIKFSDLKVTKDQDWQISISTQARAIGVIDGVALAEALAGIKETDIEEVMADFPNVAQILVKDNAGDKLPRLPRWLNIQVEQGIY